MSHQNRDHLPEMARTGLASHFLHCWANQLWATETLPSPLCLSCALEHDGVLVLQDCEASQNSHAKEINSCESRRISIYIWHRLAEETPCHSYVSQPLQTCSPSSLLSFPGAKSGTCGQTATELRCSFASPAECHEKSPGPALSGVRHDARERVVSSVAICRLAGIPLPFRQSDAIVNSSFTLLTTHGLLLDNLVAFALCESWEMAYRDICC